MPLAQVKLDCGYNINVNEILVISTYSSLLEGSPNNWTNKLIMNRRRKWLQDTWGAKAIHEIGKTAFLNESGQEELFPIFTAALSWSCVPVRNFTKHASWLITITFFERFDSNILIESIDKLKVIPWPRLASDHDW